MHEAVRFGNLSIVLRLNKSSLFIRVPRAQQVFDDNDSENLFRKFQLLRRQLVHTRASMLVNDASFCT